MVNDVLEYTIYKDKPYKNSNGDSFGVTINGKQKDFVQAYNKFWTLLKKGKIYNVDYKVTGSGQFQKGKIKFLSIVTTSAIIDAVVEVDPQVGQKGNVQLKS